MNLWHIGCLAVIVGSAAPAAGQVLPRPTISRPTIAPPTVTSGRYRVVISGFATAKETVDRDQDGKKDEVYAAAAFALWDRRDGRMISVPNMVRTREYGDVGGKNSNRIQAGSASSSGGIWGGNGAEYVPNGLDPRATVGPTPQSDQFPLLIFEGGLSDGVEALLVSPSLWESDGMQVGYDNYSTNWKTGGIAKLLGSPAVQNQLANPNLTSAVVPGDNALQVVSALANVFSGGIIGSYFLGASTIVTNHVDRPIGLAPYQNADQYQDRVVVITREKLLSLAVGSGITIAIPFAEPYDNQLNGMYTAFLRVERVQ
jgi:hypothetical protein